jgi:hypothetical protein
MTSGKQIVDKQPDGMTAVRNILTGQISVMTPADREVYDTFCAALSESLAPEPGSSANSLTPSRNTTGS